MTCTSVIVHIEFVFIIIPLAGKERKHLTLNEYNWECIVVMEVLCDHVDSLWECGREVSRKNNSSKKNSKKSVVRMLKCHLRSNRSIIAFIYSSAYGNVCVGRNIA